jgi:FkbM family methyltransferase
MGGEGRDGTWNIVAVEAYRVFTPQQLHLKKELETAKAVKSFTLFDATAISTTSGNVTFYLNNPTFGSVGSSIMNNSKSVQGPNNSKVVKSINVATFLHKMNLHWDDNVILKVDIEGAEFLVLRRIIAAGLLPYIDVLAVEWHEQNSWVLGSLPQGKGSFREECEHQHKCLAWLVQDSNTTLLDWGHR